MTNIIHSALGFKKMSPAQKIAASFLIVILSGAILLTLPISTKDGSFFNPLDALFTAASATCVTGLSTVTVADTFNLFGQIVILAMIQVGGLGLMTFMAIFIIATRRKLSINEKIVVREMLNQENLWNTKTFLLDILRYTLIFEGVGAILLAFRMIPDYGVWDGIFKSIFLSISAFCNAGFDTLGSTSLQAYAHDPLVCLTIMALIVIGGIGFAVWFDMRDKIKDLLKRKITFHKFRHSLSLHTKIVLFVSAVLILVPALLILILEYKNPQTLGTFTFPEKVMTAFFESIALRTAGFSTIAYSGLQSATSLLMIVVMFIGGSPGGTAGGVKTTTVALLVIYIVSALKGNGKMVVWKRTIGQNLVTHAMGIFFLNLLTLLTGTFLLCIVEYAQFIKIAFEAASALATVGSSLGITADLTSLGKIVIIMMMYIGRIGISTLLISILRHKSGNTASNKVSYPTGNIIVG